MAVYVDPIMPTIPTRKWPFRYACHLLADSDIELQQFARRLSLRREWYQCQGILPHYDLTYSKRLLALRLGAIRIDGRQAVLRYLAAKKNLEQNASV